MDLEPGRIGFMSTQRRESRWQRNSDTGSAKVSGLCLARIAQNGCARANGGTAPPQIAAGLATNSLQSDYRTLRFVPQDEHRGSPPPGAERRAFPCIQTTHGLSLPHAPLPSGLLRLHPTLPRVLTACACQAERYDGKRNMYLQHAA